jgi:hypothetical protein
MAHVIDTLTYIDNLIYQHIHNPAKVYPTLVDPIELTTSASAWTWGTIVEIVPVDTITKDFDVHYINVRKYLLMTTLN